MKKILLIGGIVVLLIMIIASYSCNAKADEIQPAFSGDIFLNKELYLFNQYTTTPNYENGYRAKKTITYNDIYSGDNEIYNTWYFQLGHDLVDTPENEPYFDTLEWWLYIPLNLTLAQYVQLGIIADTTKSQEFYIYLSDGSYYYRDSNQELYNEFLFTLPQAKNNIGVEFIAWSVSPPDYYASFHPLTSELAYEFGYNTGYIWGYRDGHETGYNTGNSASYNSGFDAGYISASEELGRTPIVSFKQIINNGNFANTDNWSVNYGATFTTQNNKGYVTPNNLFGSIGSQYFALYENHKYLLMFDYEINIYNWVVYAIYQNYQDFFIDTTYLNVDQQSKYLFVTSNKSANTRIVLQYNGSTYLTNQAMFTNCMMFDLTSIYGAGNEPTTIERFKSDFPSNYYDYSINENDIEIGYNQGYETGKNDGIQQGINIGETHNISVSNWFMSIFDMFGTFLGIQILPGVTIGLIVGVPFIISLAWFVIRMYRGGGGD